MVADKEAQYNSDEVNVKANIKKRPDLFAA